MESDRIESESDKDECNISNSVQIINNMSLVIEDMNINVNHNWNNLLSLRIQNISLNNYDDLW